MSRKHVFHTLHAFALLGLAATAQAQTIYKCGATYSQTPCPGATELNVNDTSDPARKQEVDAATRRDAKLASELEKDRLQLEAKALAATPKTTKASTASKKNLQAAKLATPDTTDQPLPVLKPKKLHPPGNKPKGFVALAPVKASKKAPAASK